MSIDPRLEALKTFGQGARMFPRRRGDRPVHPTTLWRWHRHGVMCSGRRVYLEAIRTPSGLATTVEAIHRFLSALNNVESVREAVASRANVDSAVAQLDADGI